MQQHLNFKVTVINIILSIVTTWRHNPSTYPSIQSTGLSSTVFSALQQEMRNEHDTRNNYV